MKPPETILKIMESKQCPLYSPGDVFTLSAASLMFPPGKPSCIILVGDISEAAKLSKRTGGNPLCHFTCSGPQKGCPGLVRLEGREGTAFPESLEIQEKYEKIRSIIKALAQYPMFRGLSENQLGELGTFLKFRQAAKGETIIRKGDPGLNLYIILSGKVDVTGEGGVHIAYLGKGEVFGEMSLISGEAVAATVRAMEPAKILYIRGKDFLRILEHYPSVQRYLAQMLARRLSQSNMAMSEELASGMAGRLSDINPSELFQTLNANGKTGAVEFTLSGGKARVGFRDGELIRAVYGPLTGTDAFFEILRQNSGQFRFTSELSPEEKESSPLGDFMWLLMEGIRKIDEEELG
ncbi:MAG: cyclic nucleotide-binding domain-containing protein [Desulfobacterales bacterium]